MKSFYENFHISCRSHQGHDTQAVAIYNKIKKTKIRVFRNL